MSNTLTQRFSTQHAPQKSYSSDNSSPSFHRMSSSSSIKSHSKRPSLTNWLNRNGTSTKSGNRALPPVQVSAPVVVRGLDAFDQHLRSGVLGAGATVVGTPQEALDRVPGVHLEPYAEEEDDGTTSLNDYETGRKPIQPAVKYDEAELPSPPDSPERALPSLPEFTQSQPNLPYASSSKPPCPTRMPPSPPTLRPSIKQSSTKGSSQTHDYDKSPVVPNHLSIPTPSPQPPFSAVLLSPAAPIDRSKVIVHIETETQTFRTSVNTIVSRPSYLASYVEQVLNMAPVTPGAKSDDASVYSEDASVFHRYLASEGVLSASSCNLKLFLDRPSSPYKHILAYLRAPTDASSSPVLPRSARLTLEMGASISMVDLLELRDEALYLGLRELYALCTEELRLYLSEQARMHARGWSASEPSRYSSESGVDREESGRAQMVTPQSLDTQANQRRSRSLTRTGQQPPQHSRDGSGSNHNNTIKRPSHMRNESQLSTRWI